VGHLQDNGFAVELTEVPNIADFQEELGVPQELRGCHSAQIGDHMIEGHVPADLIKRFIADDGGEAGISVPGMVVGPPGMEGAVPVPFDVVTFDDEWEVTHYETRPGNVRR